MVATCCSPPFGPASLLASHPISRQRDGCFKNVLCRECSVGRGVGLARGPPRAAETHGGNLSADKGLHVSWAMQRKSGQGLKLHANQGRGLIARLDCLKEIQGQLAGTPALFAQMPALGSGGSTAQQLLHHGMTPARSNPTHPISPPPLVPIIWPVVVSANAVSFWLAAKADQQHRLGVRPSSARLGEPSRCTLTLTGGPLTTLPSFPFRWRRECTRLAAGGWF